MVRVDGVGGVDGVDGVEGVDGVDGVDTRRNIVQICFTCYHLSQALLIMRV